MNIFYRGIYFESKWNIFEAINILLVNLSGLILGDWEYVFENAKYFWNFKH